MKKELSLRDIDRIIEMGWEDRTPFVLEPWSMTALEQQAYSCVLGKDYPKAIVAIKETYKHASTVLWHMKRNPTVRRERKRILAMHTLPDRENIMDR